MLRGWDANAQRLHVIRNGVDLLRFRPLPPEAMRAELGLTAQPILLSVGHLIERKGHHVAIDAMPAILEAQIGPPNLRG